MLKMRKRIKRPILISEIKAHAYFKTIIEILAKFQNDWLTSVGGVALTRYLPPIHFCCIRV